MLIDDGHVRLRVERVDNGRAVMLGGSSAASVESHKGVNLPGVVLAHPLAHGEGPQRSRVRARPGSGLRRAVVRALARRRARSPGSHRASRLTGARDRQDREGRSRACAGADRGRVRRRDGRPWRPGSRDRPVSGAAAPEADDPRRARAGPAGDHGDADARVDAPRTGANTRGGQRRRQRRPGRHVGAHAVGGDGHRRVPRGGSGDDGHDCAGGRAESRPPARAAERWR